MTTQNREKLLELWEEAGGIIIGDNNNVLQGLPDDLERFIDMLSAPQAEPSYYVLETGHGTSLRKSLDGVADECKHLWKALYDEAPSAPQAEEREPRGIYVASRASVPARPAMWRSMRDSGVPIISTWIDEAGDGETADFAELWSRIEKEVSQCERLVLYVEPSDLPLKGAFIEIGMALALGKPAFVVCPGISLDPRDYRPLGSWAKHPLVSIVSTVDEAVSVPLSMLRDVRPSPAQPSQAQEPNWRKLLSDCYYGWAQGVDIAGPMRIAGKALEEQEPVSGAVDLSDDDIKDCIDSIDFRQMVTADDLFYLIAHAVLARAQPAAPSLTDELIKDMEFTMAVAGRIYPERVEAISKRLAAYRNTQTAAPALANEQHKDFCQRCCQVHASIDCAPETYQRPVAAQAAQAKGGSDE